MKLPYRNSAYIPREKLSEYLLSETHAIGRFKAKFFNTLGYNESNINLLEKLFLQIARSRKIKDKVKSSHGTKYILDGKLISPSGKSVPIRTVWIIEPKQIRPRFVTAYPM